MGWSIWAQEPVDSEGVAPAPDSVVEELDPAPVVVRIESPPGVEHVVATPVRSVSGIVVVMQSQPSIVTKPPLPCSGEGGLL